MMCGMPADFLPPNIDANSYVLSSFLCQALPGTLTMYLSSSLQNKPREQELFIPFKGENSGPQKSRVTFHRVHSNFS